MNFEKPVQFKKLNGNLAALIKNRPAGLLATFILLLFLYALIIFGLYAVKEPGATEANAQLQVKKELYDSVLERLKTREANIQQGTAQNYPNIFR